MFYESVLRSFQQLLNLKPTDCSKIGVTVGIPKFPENVILGLCDEFISLYSKRHALLDLQDDILIIGDLHGNLVDLLRIINSHSSLEFQKILFLGDYVDRGEFSIETIALLISLAIKYQNNIFLLRGNHELESVNSVFGLAEEIKSEYGNYHLHQRLNEAFTYLPIAATIDQNIFCVHGGISNECNLLSKLSDISLPITNDQNPLIRGLLWNDPSDGILMYGESKRGRGLLFGRMAFQQFCMDTGCEKLIRAHECVKDGIRFNFDDNVITVFSSSNYSPDSKNCCAILKIKHGSNEFLKFDPIDNPITRQTAAFINSECHDPLAFSRISMAGESPNRLRANSAIGGMMLLKRNKNQTTKRILQKPTSRILPKLMPN